MITFEKQTIFDGLNNLPNVNVYLQVEGLLLNILTFDYVGPTTDEQPCDKPVYTILTTQSNGKKTSEEARVELDLFGEKLLQQQRTSLYCQICFYFCNVAC